MTAPLVWIFFPLVGAAILLVLPRERLISYLGAALALLLAAIAFWLPPDTAQRIGPLSLRIDSAFSVLGRQISLTAADQTLLILVYGMAAFWFFGTLAAGGARQIVSLGLVVIALLAASLAVQPFLFAALLIELAVLVSIPLLAAPGQRAGRGLLHFLIYQTLAMPFILFSGFLLTGVEAGPGDVAQISQAAALLAMGFAFLLAVFPLNTWIPLLAEEAPPYAVGFLLIIFPTFSLVFALNFFDHYSWLRTSAQLTAALQWVGLATAVTAGVWAAFQRHLGRLAAYAAIADVGIALAALGLAGRQTGLQIVFYLLAPRAIALGVWMLSITVFARRAPDLKFTSVQGLAREFPLAAAGVVLSNLALAGTPLLATFPVRLALWDSLAVQSLTAAFWLGMVSLGLWVGAMRSLAVLTMSPQKTPWAVGESWTERILITLGLAGLFLLGIFPQWIQPLLTNFPAMFEHLGK